MLNDACWLGCGDGFLRCSQCFLSFGYLLALTLCSQCIRSSVLGGLQRRYALLLRCLGGCEFVDPHFAKFFLDFCMYLFGRNKYKEDGSRIKAKTRRHHHY